MKKFTEQDYTALLNKLNELADEKYKAFHERLVPGIENVKGVKSPEIKKLAKEIAKTDPEGYLEIARHDTYEEIMIHGSLLGFLKMPIEQRLKYFEDFTVYVTNWAVCDLTCSNFKFKDSEALPVYDFAVEYIKSEEEYKIRIGAVLLMDYFVKEDYIDEVLKHYDNVVSDKYYVNMAIAWGISLCFIKFREKTLAFLKITKLDNFTYNKALQKIIESSRVSLEDKDLMRSMKRKK